MPPPLLSLDAPAIDRVRDRALVALAAEACGAAGRALELAVAYAKQRTQFGRPIGSFQGVSHELARAYMDVEIARSLTYWAAWAVETDDPEAPTAAAAAKARAAEAAVVTCERAIQAHGGVGFTWEHPLHRFYKRALAIAARLEPVDELWSRRGRRHGREQRWSQRVLHRRRLDRGSGGRRMSSAAAAATPANEDGRTSRGRRPRRRRSAAKAPPADPGRGPAVGTFGPDGFDKMRLTGDRLIVRIPEDRERRSKTGLLIPPRPP